MKNIKCPFCGYKMPIVFSDTSFSSGVLVKCKARHCKKTFEITVKDGKQYTKPWVRDKDTGMYISIF